MLSFAISRIPIFVAIFALLLTGCTAMQPASDGGMDGDMAMEMKPEPGKITIVDARSRPSPMSAANGAAYMVVLNGLDADVQLVSAESDISEVVETHETVNDEGVMRMIPMPDGYPVPAGGMVELKPGGKHIMLINLVAPLETGQEFDLTVNFDNGESMTITVPVVEMDGMPMNMEMDDSEGEMDMDADSEHEMDDDESHEEDKDDS